MSRQSESGGSSSSSSSSSASIIESSPTKSDTEPNTKKPSASPTKCKSDTEPEAKKRKVDELGQGSGTVSPNAIVTFDVSGTKFKIKLSTIRKHPNTYLDNVTKCWSEDEKEEIFIERDAGRFRYILDFYRSGRVRIP